MKTRPEICTEEHLVYLDDLRESGETSMFGATPYLEDYFEELTKAEASEILWYWMDSFEERHVL